MTTALKDYERWRAVADTQPWYRATSEQASAIRKWLRIEGVIRVDPTGSRKGKYLYGERRAGALQGRPSGLPLARYTLAPTRDSKGASDLSFVVSDFVVGQVSAQGENDLAGEALSLLCVSQVFADPAAGVRVQPGGAADVVHGQLVVDGVTMSEQVNGHRPSHPGADFLDSWLGVIERGPENVAELVVAAGTEPAH
ncbi:hypothetical protein [Nonomuraea sp. NPDC050691]|uniref:hypothetical protein n=1 Tax=Nonomuraea sp. NPDC050691 TaxID=3155661 RepID=UPI0033FE47BB